MSAPVDPVRAFTSALTASARRAYGDVAYDAIPLVRTACERLEPAALARICSTGISWRSPTNASGLILYRLRREAGQLDNDQEVTD